MAGMRSSGILIAEQIEIAVLHLRHRRPLSGLEQREHVLDGRPELGGR